MCAFLYWPTSSGKFQGSLASAGIIMHQHVDGGRVVQVNLESTKLTTMYLCLNVTTFGFSAALPLNSAPQPPPLPPQHPQLDIAYRGAINATIFCRSCKATSSTSSTRTSSIRRCRRSTPSRRTRRRMSLAAPVSCVSMPAPPTRCVLSSLVCM